MARYTTAVALREDVRAQEEAFRELMPKGYRLDRFLSSLDTWVARHPEILTCEPESIVAECQKAVNDGMVFDGRKAVLVRFFERKTKRYLAQYMPMYQGILERLRDLGDLHGVDCQAVYDKDFWEVYQRENKTIVNWEPCLDGPRGRVRGAFVHFKDRGGQVIHTEVIFRDGIEKARAKSGNPNGEAWRDWYEEMARKTVIHRGAKYVPLSDDGRRIVSRDEAFSSLLEGKALPSPRDPADNPLADPSLDDFDDDGNPIRPASQARGTSAEDAVPSVIELHTPPQARVIEEAVVLEEDGSDLFDVADEPPSPLDPFEEFFQRLSEATTLAEATAIAAELKPQMAEGSRESRLEANRVWAATLERLKKPAPAPAQKRQRRRA